MNDGVPSVVDGTCRDLIARDGTRWVLPRTDPADVEGHRWRKIPSKVISVSTWDRSRASDNLIVSNNDTTQNESDEGVGMDVIASSHKC